MNRRMINGVNAQSSAIAVACSEGLSARERQIIALIGQGKTSKEIAVRLALSVATIGSHRRSLCRKLRVHSTAELVHYAVREFWFPPV